MCVCEPQHPFQCVKDLSLLSGWWLGRGWGGGGGCGRDEERGHPEMGGRGTGRAGRGRRSGRRQLLVVGTPLQRTGPLQLSTLKGRFCTEHRAILLNDNRFNGGTFTCLCVCVCVCV